MLPESPNTRSNRLLYPCLCPSSLAHSPRQCRHPLWTSPVGPPKAPPPFSSPQYPNLSPRTRFPKFGAISLTHPSRALTSSSSFLTHHTPPRLRIPKIEKATPGCKVPEISALSGPAPATHWNPTLYPLPVMTLCNFSVDATQQKPRGEVHMLTKPREKGSVWNLHF